MFKLIINKRNLNGNPLVIIFCYLSNQEIKGKKTTLLGQCIIEMWGKGILYIARESRS